ncbi:hypothetical protein [Cylindrospermopsis raciborskii]|nr:hypothetical protein [Cylindrospermopsis raciborskii]
MIKSWLDEKNDLLLSELCDRLREMRLIGSIIVVYLHENRCKLTPT